MKTIKTFYFPIELVFATPLILAGAFYVGAKGHYIWTGILTFASLLIITTKYITSIDKGKNKFRDYLSILWIPLNELSSPFATLEKIVITKGNYSQTVNTQFQSSQRNWSEYTATLIYNEEMLLEILTRNKKKELILKIAEMALYLDIPIEDQTSSEYYLIDPKKSA